MVDDANQPPPNNAGRKHVGTIDMTPTWRSLMPIFFTVLQDGTPEGKKAAMEELTRLADFADQVNAERKAS